MPTVIFADSFDHYASADAAKKGWGSSNGVPITAGVGRNGTPGCGVVNGGSYITQYIQNLPTLYVEIAAKFNLHTVDTTLIQFQDANSNQVDLRITPNGELKVTRNGTQLGVTSGVGLGNATYYHIGFAATIHPTAGMYEVRVQGVSKLSATNQNTRNTANNQITSVNFIGPGPGNVNWFDDVVICTDGFCGDCRVVPVYPQAAGNYSQWTPTLTSYVNSGGKGARTALITVSKSGSADTSCIDGNYSGAGPFFSGANGPSNYLRFDFGSARVITEIKGYYQAVVGGTWKWQGSNDASAWTDIGASFLLDQVNMTFAQLSANATAYRYYQLIGVSGTVAANNHYEYEFKIDGSPAGWQNVNDAQMNSDDNYVYTATPGNRNCYDFQALGLTGNVKAVQHVVAARKDDAGSRVVQLFARAGGADYDGPNLSTTDTYLFQRRILTTNPATGAPWNSVEVDAAQFGTKLVS